MIELIIFRMAPWFRAISLIATVLLCTAGTYIVLLGGSILYRAGAAALVIVGIASFLDVMRSTIVLDAEGITVSNLMGKRTYARAEFESATVDGRVVVLKKRDGGWVKLPSTGHNTLAVRNTIDAWIKRA